MIRLLTAAGQESNFKNGQLPQNFGIGTGIKINFVSITIYIRQRPKQ